MIDYDGRPGHPPDRTVCGDRRPRCSTSSGAGAPTAADRRRIGVSGRGPGAAWVRLRAPLDPLCLLPAGPPVPLLAQPARLPQAAAGRRATAGPGDQPPGPGQPVVVRQAAADSTPRRCRVEPRGRRSTARTSAEPADTGFVPPTPATTGASSSIWSPRPTECPSPGAWRTRSSREREVCLDLMTIAVETGLVAPGATVLADKGLAGRDVEQQIAGLGVRLLRPDRRNEPRPAWQPRGRPTVDRVGVRHPQGPTRPGAPRGPHRAWRVHPRRSAPA